MVASDSAIVVPRLKREDCTRTKHDSVFSKWKVLVGPSDWEDYSLGKEGAERYRIHNLPKTANPGVYELGIAITRTGLGRDINKLNPYQIVVVYLGQADNVRARLQQYGRSGAHLGNGRSGAHLGNGRSTGIKTDCNIVPQQKRPGLFELILSRCYPIVYRWAPMQSKSEALKTETRLLNTFDYAWNTTTNGSRRPDDVIKKLDKISSKAVQLSDIARKLLPFSQKQVGIRIKASKLPSKENESNASADEESHNFISRVFKFNRSRPRLVRDSNELIQKNTIICGVALGNGSICRSSPVKGRKRCSEHKGMKINTQHTIVVSKSSSTYNIECDGFPAHDLSDCMGELPVLTVKYPDSESFTPTCGFILPDGCSPCRSQPTKGNKRCHEHKGRRIRRSNSTLVKEKQSHYVADVVSESKTTENSTANLDDKHDVEFEDDFSSTW